MPRSSHLKGRRRGCRLGAPFIEGTTSSTEATCLETTNHGPARIHEGAATANPLRLALLEQLLVLCRCAADTFRLCTRWLKGCQRENGRKGRTTHQTQVSRLSCTTCVGEL